MLRLTCCSQVLTWTAAPASGAVLPSQFTPVGAEPVVYGAGLAGRVRALAPDGVDLALDVAGSGVLPELIESGRFSLPVAQTFPLAEVAEAHRGGEQGHVREEFVLLVG